MPSPFARSRALSHPEPPRNGLQLQTDLPARPRTRSSSPSTAYPSAHSSSHSHPHSPSQMPSFSLVGALVGAWHLRRTSPELLALRPAAPVAEEVDAPPREPVRAPA